jgi:hypothetical protein
MTTTELRAGKTYFVREVAIAFMLTGVVVHVISAIMGLEFLRQYIFTPKFDLVLMLAIGYAAVGLPITWRKYDLSPTWRRIVYAIIVVFCWVELPVHLQIQMSQDTSILKMSPPGYDFMILPVLLFFAGFLINLKPSPTA